MRWFFPWGSFLKKSGGTITGSLTVNGETIHNNTVRIVKDVAAIGDPHLELRPATGAGLYDIIECQDLVGAFEGGFGSDITTNIFMLPGIGGAMVAPVDLVDPDPPWDIPLMTQSLGVRRMLLFHSMIFG